MLEVGSLVELEIEDVAYGGEFIARYGNIAVFVRGAILGERVLAEIIKCQAKLCRAIVREVLRAADARISHPWPLGSVEATGAADYGHIELSAQRELKGKMLQNQLRRIGGEEILAKFSDEMFCVESAESGRDGALFSAPETAGWHYRTRIDVLKLRTGVGMHLLRTNRHVPLRNMPLASEKFGALDLFGTVWDGFVSEKKRMRLVAPSIGNPVVVLDDRVYCAPNVQTDAHIQEQVVYRGKTYRYQIHAGSFWQIHENAPASLVSHVYDALKPNSGDKIVDLYCGSGLFSVIGADLAGRKGFLRGYEGDKRAASFARKNLAHLNQADAQAVNIDYRNIGKLVAGADLVIADPPRAGLGVAAAQILGNSAVRKIVLVSCDSASMARDLSVLLTAGREIESFTAVDIFPNTHYVETVAVLSKGK